MEDQETGISKKASVNGYKESVNMERRAGYGIP